jgi:hypothetical protein
MPPQALQGVPGEPRVLAEQALQGDGQDQVLALAQAEADQGLVQGVDGPAGAIEGAVGQAQEGGGHRLVLFDDLGQPRHGLAHVVDRRHGSPCHFRQRGQHAQVADGVTQDLLRRRLAA